MIKSFLTKKKESINYLLLSIMVCTPMISSIVRINNTIPVMFSIIVIVIVTLNLNELLNSRNYIPPFIYLFIFMTLIILNLFITGLNNYNIKRILYFILYGVFTCTIFYTFFVSIKNFDFFKLNRYIIFVYAILSLFIFQVNYGAFYYRDRMAISYNMLPVYIALFYDLILDPNRNIKYILLKIVIFVLVFFPYFNFFLKYLSRGAFISIVFCIFITCLLFQNRKNQLIIIFFSVVILIIGLFFAYDLLKFLQEFLDYFNLSFSFVDRSIELIKSNNIDNGRNAIYLNAINGILKHPILGNGIGHFEYIYDTYPHNFILQSWYEGGLFYMIFLCFPIFYSFIRIVFFDDININIRFLYIFIFSISIIRLMISYEYWLDLFFWLVLLISILIIQKDIKKISLSNSFIDK